jgi:hypothetical protein
VSRGIFSLLLLIWILGSRLQQAMLFQLMITKLLQGGLGKCTMKAQEAYELFSFFLNAS